VNPEKNASFEVTSQAALNGVKSATLQNFGQNVKSVDELVSAPFDLTEINKDKLITLSFRYAYRKLKSTTREYLYVYLSNDCGVNWSSKLYLDGSRLSTVVDAASWKPTQASEWKTVHLKTIDSKYWQPGTRLKFMFKNDAVNGGNNLYLDDINLYAGSPSDSIVKLEEKDTTTASTLSHSLSIFKLYPNPVKDIVTITNANSDQPIEVEITDLVGKIHVVKEIISINNEFNLSLENLEAGTYIVVLKSGEVTEIQKIIKE
jgi:hypothetical protein